MSILRMILAFLRAFFASWAKLAAENAMLRQQLIVLQRSVPRQASRAIWGITGYLLVTYDARGV